MRFIHPQTGAPVEADGAAAQILSTAGWKEYSEPQPEAEPEPEPAPEPRKTKKTRE